MKKLSQVFAVVIAAASLTALAEGMSLAEARAQIGEAVTEPAKLTAVMRQLSAADQVAYLAEVNAAIAKMPGSGEVRGASFLKAGRAALRGAAKGNVAPLLAEILATVPVECLPAIVENFAGTVFNRTADASKTVSDDDFEKTAKATLEKIVARNASADDADVRNTFAVILFARASNGTPQGLSDRLADQIGDGKAIAKEEWLPAALAETPSYEGMLGSANAGRQPVSSLVIRLGGAEYLDALLIDLTAQPQDDGTGTKAASLATTPLTAKSYVGLDGVGDGLTGLDRLPKFYNRKTFANERLAGMSRNRKIGDGVVRDVYGRYIAPGGTPVGPNYGPDRNVIPKVPVGPDGRPIPFGPEPGPYMGQRL